MRARFFETQYKYSHTHPPSHIHTLESKHLSARRSELGRRFFRSVTIPDNFDKAEMTFPDDQIQKLFPGFDETLSIQYYELRLIYTGIASLSTMTWLNINNLIKYFNMPS